MSKFFAVILIFFLSLGFSADALGQPDINVIKSLKNIEAKAQKGTSYDAVDAAVDQAHHGKVFAMSGKADHGSR
jgi:hypothetical protein